MDIKELILKELKNKGSVTVKTITKRTGFSQPYIHRFFQSLIDEGRIIRIGNARNARYFLATKKIFQDRRMKTMNFTETLTNDKKTRIDEHMVLDSIKNNTGILSGLHSNVSEIIDYAFTELLNNAYEHSNSKLIQVKMKRDSNGIMLRVNDEGIGIFNSLMTKYNLPTEIDAIGDLLKGKRTTAPKEHSGEGIFFTSKVCDNMIIQSSVKRVIFNNILEDVFIRSFHETKGTKVTFYISLKSKRDLTSVFNQYTDEEYEFSKTNVTVKLYKTGNEYISRSQARRITAGLEKFKTITLDFRDVDTVGQSFADEIFRVWKNNHPGINIITKNENDNISFMIKRAIAESRSVLNK